MSLRDDLLASYVADALLGSVDSTTDSDLLTTYTQIVSTLNTEMQLGYASFDDISQWQWAMLARTALEKRIGEISNICVVGAEQGYVFPDDPAPSIIAANQSRKLFDPFPPSFDAVAVGSAIRELNGVVVAVDAGKISLDRPASAGQIASFEVSVDGISPQSGDPLADILGYQPDADYIKRKQAMDALSRLDFSKRKPYLLFVADLIEDGRRTGETVVCWQRMRDAAGYKISRRDTLAMIDRPPMTVDNSYLDASTLQLKGDPRFNKMIALYDWLAQDDYYAVVDQTTPNTVFRYTVSGFQRKIPAGQNFFDVKTSALYLSDSQVQAFRSAVADEADAFKVSTGSISPYPSLAKVVYGDPSYGWVIAGCNFLASVKRNDPGSMTRSLAFVGSNIDTVSSALTAQQLVLPNSLSDIVDSITSGISSYGISQTILSILDGVGATDFISGKDPTSGVNPTTDSLSTSEGGLSRLLAAIDPETATVDPKVLIASLGSPQKLRATYTPFSMGEGHIIKFQPPRPDPLQIIGTDPIDLTTYVGISRLLVAIRDFYDLYPGML